MQGNKLANMVGLTLCEEGRGKKGLAYKSNTFSRKGEGVSTYGETSQYTLCSWNVINRRQGITVPNGMFTHYAPTLL